jgi:hypothetical protein
MAAAAAQSSVDRAHTFLDSAMDQFTKAPTLPLPSSYHRGKLDSWHNSVLYDDALVSIAYARDSRSAAKADSLTGAKSMRAAPSSAARSSS